MISLISIPCRVLPEYLFVLVWLCNNANRNLTKCLVSCKSDPNIKVRHGHKVLTYRFFIGCENVFLLSVVFGGMHALGMMGAVQSQVANVFFVVNRSLLPVLTLFSRRHIICFII